MVKERSSETRFQIYEDTKGPRGENAQNISVDESKPDKRAQRSTTRLPSINPEDYIMESIEHSDNEEEEDVHAVSASELSDDEEDHHRSPRISHSDSISEFPEEQSPHHEGLSHSHSPYTPVKQRSPFRHTSSVRAIQMDVTPPFNHYMASPLSHRHKFTTSSRVSTPRSIRSQSTKSKIVTPSPKKEYPLVLLHVTLLPITFPYSLELMTAVLPPYIIENYNLLKDKATDTVLQRGILVPHPREDYELLEERLLESLELKLPRILQCGHFHRDEDEECDSDEDRYASEDEDADICDDCGRRVRNGRLGAGTGRRRWSIKIFAANGLMRAGAWGAAWREMERVDVEIEPWIPEDLRRELDVRRLEMEEAEEERRHEDVEEQDHRKVEGERAEATTREEEGVKEQAGCSRQSHGDSTPSDERRAYSMQDSYQKQHSRSPSLHGPELQHRKLSRAQSEPPSAAELAHTALLAAGLQVQHWFHNTDKRNVAIAFLAVLVLVLSLNSSSSRIVRLPPSNYPYVGPPVALQEFPPTPIATTTVTVAVPTAPLMEKHDPHSMDMGSNVDDFVSAGATSPILECSPALERKPKGEADETTHEGQLKEGPHF